VQNIQEWLRVGSLSSETLKRKWGELDVTPRGGMVDSSAHATRRYRVTVLTPLPGNRKGALGGMVDSSAHATRRHRVTVLTPLPRHDAHSGHLTKGGWQVEISCGGTSCLITSHLLEVIYLEGN
jgi:hypothetical protein